MNPRPRNPPMKSFGPSHFDVVQGPAGEVRLDVTLFHRNLAWFAVVMISLVVLFSCSFPTTPFEFQVLFVVVGILFGIAFFSMFMSGQQLETAAGPYAVLDATGIHLRGGRHVELADCAEFTIDERWGSGDGRDYYVVLRTRSGETIDVVCSKYDREILAAQAALAEALQRFRATIRALSL